MAMLKDFTYLWYAAFPRRATVRKLIRTDRQLFAFLVANLFTQASARPKLSKYNALWPRYNDNKGCSFFASLYVIALL